MTKERNRIIELLDDVIELKKQLLGTVQLRAELAAATDALAECRAAVRLFLSGAAPCDRGSMWPRKDVMDMEAVIAKIRGDK